MVNLVFHHKAKVHNHYLLEQKIWEIDDKKRYPNGFKYSLVCINLKTKEKILFDNHSPKGHHFHINEDEFDYDFKDENKLMTDFIQLVYEKFGVRI